MSGKKTYSDKHADCSDCKAPFTITTREQVFLETLGYSMPKRCLKCRRSGKSKKKSASAKMATSIREMFEAGEFHKLFESPTGNGDTPPTSPPTEPVPEIAEPVVPRTPEQNLLAMKTFFGVVPIKPDQPEASTEDIKVLMTRANEMRWPCDHYKCRKQHCSENGHIHPYLTSQEGKSLIRSLYNVQSSKELRKPQIEFLYTEFGRVLSGTAFLDRDGQGTVYIATPDGKTEEEVRANVLKYS